MLADPVPPAAQHYGATPAVAQHAQVRVNGQLATTEKCRPCTLLAGDPITIVTTRGGTTPALVSASPALRVREVPPGAGIELGFTRAAEFVDHLARPGVYLLEVDAAEVGWQDVTIVVFPREVLDDAHLKYQKDGGERSEDERRAIVQKIGARVTPSLGQRYLPTLLKDACAAAGKLPEHYEVTTHKTSCQPWRTHGNVALLSGWGCERLGCGRSMLSGIGIGT
jgi:hypothetical protein